jgi:PqqD family protein of HPr-rel-A system
MANWQINSEEIRVRAWDDLIVVYNCYTGDTHCIDNTGTAVFSALEKFGTATAEQLDEALINPMDMSGVEPAATRAALGQLERFRIVRRLP